jgi:hypothetical protein
MTRAEVESERARRGAGPEHYEVRDFERLLRVFPLVKSHAAQQHLLSKTMPVVLSRPAGARRAFFDRLQRAQRGVRFAPMPVSSYTPDVECMLNFDDPDLIALLPGHAGNTYATLFTQPCGDGSGLLRLEAKVYGHFHLSFENPAVGCTTPEGQFGYGSPGDPNCQPLDDYTLEPRFLNPHLGDEIISIWRSAGFIGVELPFALHSFANVGSQSVTLRFRKSNGDWFKFTNLYGHTNWLMGGWVTDVVEVQVTHVVADPPCGANDWEAPGPDVSCPTGLGIYSLDRFAIDPE